MSGLDLRYGRQGGRRLPPMTSAEQDAMFAAALDAGEIVYAACFCTFWWLIAKDVGSLCGHCDHPMVPVKAP